MKRDTLAIQALATAVAFALAMYTYFQYPSTGQLMVAILILAAVPSYHLVMWLRRKNSKTATARTPDSPGHTRP